MFKKQITDRISQSLAPSIVLNMFNTFHEMVSVASQLIEEVTAHSQSDSLEDAREICADGTSFQITYVHNKIRYVTDLCYINMVP